MTAERRINALVVVLGIVLVVALRPVSVELAAGGPTVECDVASFVVGEDARVVTDTCRDAFRGRAAAALIVLAGIAVLASQLVRHRAGGEGEVTSPARAPGEDPTVLGGVRHAAANPSFRVLAGLAVAVLAVLALVAEPVLAGERLAGGRAVGIALVAAAAGVALSMLVWIVQYHRGMALGAVWHRADVPWALLTRVCGGCATLAVIGIVVAGAADTAARPPAPESAVALADGPIAEDLTPQPTFAAPSALAVAPPSRAAAVVATQPATTPTTVRTTTRAALPAATPMAVRDASWFAANPTPLDVSTVPEGALPVGAVAGDDDVHAFFRVTGTATRLELVESDATGAQRFPEQALVRACPVLDDGWAQTSGGSFADEPRFDDTACVDVVRADAGTWSIDLGAFEDRGGRRGFALVPAEGAGTFRLTLEAQA
jgi:hypothetical protein